MKFSIVFALTAIVVVVSASRRSPKDDEDKIVDDYFVKFNHRGGGGSLDFEKRKRNVLKRLHEIEDHNEKFKRGDETYEQALNQFSQLDDDELANYNGLDESIEQEKPGNDSYPPIDRVARGDPPANWDWATKGYMVQPVQDQGSCNSCYVFAAIAALEGSLCRMYNQCTKLSEQEAMECTNGCNTGWDHYVYNYVSVYGGAAYGSNYGYTPYPRNACAAHGSRVPNSKIYSHTVRPNDSEALKTFIYQVGPVFVAFDVYNSFFNYKSGIYSGCSGSRLGGHAVLLTGYGEQNGIKYWIAKNSYGTNWGERGYFKIRRGGDYCRIESWKVSFPYSQ